MNFLAHCLLAGPGDGFVAGGILGDLIKGTIPTSMPAELRAGVRLHRRIDSFSNRLPSMRASVERFPAKLRRAAPVLLDILADHCLANAWQRYAQGDLPQFTAHAYAAVGRYRDHIPERGRVFVDRMIETDLLARYADRDVILRAMAHVLDRLRSPHLGEDLPGVLECRLPAFANDFQAYFPELQAFARTERTAAATWANVEPGTT